MCEVMEYVCLNALHMISNQLLAVMLLCTKGAAYCAEQEGPEP